MLAKAQESGQILDEEQLAFLTNLDIPDSQVAQTTIPNTYAFQTEDLDAYDSDYDDVSNAKAVLMANLSNYGSDVILEVVQIVLWYLDCGCSKHMTGNRSQLMNFISKFLGTVRFRNDQIAKIMGYGDYQLGNNLEGVDLLSGSRDTNLYTISLHDMLKTSPICLLSKASKTKSWLWHRRLSHLNFGTLNKLAKDGLARGIPKLKFKKDHLQSNVDQIEVDLQGQKDEFGGVLKNKARLAAQGFKKEEGINFEE
ncbi:integrase, catalytic region, zinc finger, CCHC-type containing protein [Tanacetum coccineum]